MAIKKATTKKKYVTVTGKNGGKITTTVGSNTYNTLIKNGGKVASSGSSSSGSSSPSSSPSNSSSQAQQLATIKSTLEKMSSDLKAGNVTGLTPSTPKVTTPTVAPANNSTYSGPSVVDYLASTGQASDYASRAKLAAEKGITGYTGTASQNTQLLNTLKLNTGGSIPSTAITNAQTPQDVLDKRAQLEGLQTQLKSKQQELADLLAASEEDPMDMGDENVNPLTNPDKYLSQYFTTDASRNMTPAQLEQKRLLDESAKATEDFYKNRDENVEEAYDEFGVTTKQKALSNIQKEMADREVKLRNDVQVLETAPEYRGVSREFANDQREQIKSKGAFDLANLAIVESAYNGDLNTARTLAQDLIDNQFETFEGKIAGYKARLAALIPTLDAEEKQQALALEAAFDQQARNLAEKKADTELKYEYMTLAAKAGAPESVYKSILKATSADEAFMLAAPYLKDKVKATDTSSNSRAPISEVVSGLSPFNGTLATLDLQSTKTTINTIKNAVREQFSTAFSTKLISSLTDEQLRDFLIQYDAAQREAGMNMDPEEVLQAYLEYIGKGSSSSGGGGDDLGSRIDNANI